MNADQFKYNYNMIPITFAGPVNDEEYEYYGEAIFYKSGNVGISIKLNSQSEDAIPLEPKQQITASFKKFFISSEGAGTALLFISNPKEIKIEGMQVDVDNVNNISQINNVNQISQILRDDSWYYETQNERAFIGAYYSNALANNFSLIELWNPADSGVLLVCKRLAAMADGVHLGAICYWNANLSVGSYYGNKYLTKAAPVGQVKAENNVATLGTIISYVHFTPNVYTEYIRGHPIIVPEGYGLLIRDNEKEKFLSAIFEWIEVPV